MLDGIPAPVRNLLWKLKHRGFKWGHRKGFAEYMQGALEQQLQADSIDLVLDVGANTGQYLRAIRRLGYHGEVISFEPLPENVRLLERAARADPRWRVVPYALGETEDTLDLHVTDDSTFSSLLPPAEYAKANFGGRSVVRETLRVPVHRLEDVLPALVPDYSRRAVHLKIDTQGTDIAVLRGLGRLTGGVRSLQIEIGMMPMYEAHQSYGAVLSEIEALGFDLTGVFVVSRDQRMRVVDADCLFRQR